MSEGWHGVRFDKPLARTREYVAIVNAALRRERVSYDGRHFTLPLPDGPGKALKLSIHPARDHVPVYLAAVGPKNLELAGEIADGWLGIFNEPGYIREQLGQVGAGRAKAGKELAGFDVVASVPTVVGDDVAACADPIRGYAALYVGGMGSREKNFYNDLAVRMGYAEEAKRVQDLYLDKQYREAMAAIPLEFVDSDLAARSEGTDRRQAHRVRRGRRDHALRHTLRRRPRPDAVRQLRGGPARSSANRRRGAGPRRDR